MRVDDYRFYGTLCQIFGAILILVGFLLPILTVQHVHYIWDILPPETRYPYLSHGIALVCLGIALIVASIIILREYELRKSEESITAETLQKPPE